MFNKRELIKATIIDLIVALLLTVLIIILIKISLGQEIDLVMSLINTVSVEQSENVEVDTILDKETNKITNYPEYGAKYATIEIPTINVNLPVYFGDTLEILKNGVGHSSGSYFPGEGGSIVYMGHNAKTIFRRFSELEKGNEIKVTTTYGEFIYEIYDMKIIKETDLHELPIQKGKEILMVYTCYPFNNIGYTTQRYVVYAERTK